MSEDGADEQINQIASLELLRWHIDRFDRLRASLAARAGAVLSATAVLVAGEAFLGNHYFAVAHKRFWDLGMATALATSFGLALGAGWSALITLVNPKAKRDPRRAALNRGAFGWPSVVRDYPEDHEGSAERFAETLIESPGYRATLREGALELWVGIHNHRRRYESLQRAVRVLRICAAAFALLAVFALAAPRA